MLVAAGVVVIVNVVAASALNDVDKKPSSYDARFSDDNSLDSGVDDNKDVAKFFDDSSDDNVVASKDASEPNVRMLVIEDGGEQQRRRRLSGDSSVMSFYRPTKKVFSSPLDPPTVILEGKQKRHENDDDVKMSTVEMSSPTFLHETDHDIGGISHFSGKKHSKLLNRHDKV